MFLKKWGVLAVLMALIGCHDSSSPTSSTDLPIIGLGEDGKAVVSYVPRGRHLKKMSGMMSAVTDKSTERLSKFEFEDGFRLTRVSVGLQVTFEFDILDLYVMEIKPAVDLRFEPLPNPNNI